MAGEDGVSERPIYRDGRVHVLTERCSTCILRPDAASIRGNLEAGRVQELVAANRAAGAAPACHHTTYGQDPRGEAICRGYWDLFVDQEPTLRLARAMDVVEYQTPPPGE